MQWKTSNNEISHPQVYIKCASTSAWNKLEDFKYLLEYITCDSTSTGNIVLTKSYSTSIGKQIIPLPLEYIKYHSTSTGITISLKYIKCNSTSKCVSKSTGIHQIMWFLIQWKYTGIH